MGPFFFSTLWLNTIVHLKLSAHNHTSQKGLTMDQRVRRIQQVMRDDLSRELPLADLAKSVNLSVWRLCHIFRTDVGTSPIQYLKSLRMEKAKWLLETSFLSVKEITHSVGLSDKSHFVRDFKRAYGVPPTLYRLVFNSGTPNESKAEKVQQAVSGDSRKLPVIALAFVEMCFTYWSG